MEAPVFWRFCHKSRTACAMQHDNVAGYSCIGMTIFSSASGGAAAICGSGFGRIAI
jgi:hypothetical protein